MSLITLLNCISKSASACGNALSGVDHQVITQPHQTAPKETLPDKLLAHIASLGWEHIGFSGGYVWPSEALKQKVSALRKLRSAFLDAAYRTI
jgi:hypothetical protein